MTIIGDVHYYTIKPQRPPTPIKTSHAPKSPLETIIDFVMPADSPATKRAKSINSHFSEASSGNSSFLSLLNTALLSRPEPLQFMIKQEAYESDIELQDRSRASTVAKKRNSFDDAYSDISPSFRPATNNKDGALKKRGTAGSSNRHRNVRSVAYSNERTNSMTIEEWIRLKNLPSPDAIVMSASTRVLIEDGSPRKRKGASPVSASPTSSGGPSIEINNKPLSIDATSPNNNGNKFYVAKYYASDDDFLMHASVRSYFKANAFEDQDHVLFTILPQNEAGGQTQTNHPTLTNLSLFLGSSESRAQSKFRKMLKWFILIYFIAAALIVRYLGKIYPEANNV